MQAYVHSLAAKKLNTNKSYRYQDMKQVKEICKSSKKVYPLLKDYDKDWPVIDIIKQHLKYKSEVRRRAEAAASMKEVKQVSRET